MFCSAPESPLGGSVSNQFLLHPVGSEVTYCCNDGLFPTGSVMTSTCTDVGGRGEWIPDPAQLVCKALGMQFPVLFLLSHNLYISANCKLPEEPLHGFIVNYCNLATIEGSVITFQCDLGFSPAAEMTATCNSSGQWSSDPSQLVCTGSDGDGEENSP